MNLGNTDDNLSSLLYEFFHQWQNLNENESNAGLGVNFTSQLDQFFKSWADLSIAELEPEKKLIVDSERLSVFFESFQPATEPMRKAKANGLMLNVWKTASLKTDEVRNSKVLKWFLDCYGDHGQKNAILLKFLQLLPEPFSKCQSENYQTIEESCPLGDQESRVDIEIDSREFLIFIEIKINAMEGQNQLQRYIDIARAKAGNRQWLIVYLTKDGKLPQRYQNNEGLFGLSWSLVAKQFKSHTKSADMNNRGIWLLSQFADHIKSFK